MHILVSTLHPYLAELQQMVAFRFIAHSTRHTEELRHCDALDSMNGRKLTSQQKQKNPKQTLAEKERPVVQPTNREKYTRKFTWLIVLPIRSSSDKHS